MAKNSFSYVDNPLVLGPNALLMNAMGWLDCIYTAPTPTALASVSIAKGLEKSGNGRSGAHDSVRFRLLNVISCSWDQMNNVFLRNKLVRGLAITQK